MGGPMKTRFFEDRVCVVCLCLCLCGVFVLHLGFLIVLCMCCAVCLSLFRLLFFSISDLLINALTLCHFSFF